MPAAVFVFPPRYFICLMAFFIAVFVENAFRWNSLSALFANLTAPMRTYPLSMDKSSIMRSMNLSSRSQLSYEPSAGLLSRILPELSTTTTMSAWKLTHSDFTADVEVNKKQPATKAQSIAPDVLMLTAAI
ncbi:hypothetical protein NP493_752g00013 [Ridgeia piscesae]|uniref:Uncharacterized protein n=1 Tax=Ridgeia piscesae TaxID=27915 RepID=A0AAD9KQP2_RIDPI|nr:hypothetical protein NP493_752g00013 [Ridgeia piscesae]